MRKIALIVALLVSSAVPGRAQRETSAFVGNFGHIITYSPDWAVTARMIGEAEEIRFHPRRFYTATDSVPFQPKAEDFKVEKFTPLHLMTLMIVPRSASSFADISDLKRAKIADLERKIGFRIIDNPPPGGYWPEGSFEVRISTPYRLRQLYVFNDSYRFILTWGEDSAGTEMSDVSGLVKTSLSKLMKLPEGSELSLEEDAAPGKLFVPAEEFSENFFSSFKAFRFFALFGILGGAMMGLAYWPGTTVRASRTRFFGGSVFVFAHLAALAGFMSVYAPIAIAGMKWRIANDATLLPVSLVPLISALAARRLGSSRARRVLFATGAIAGLWVMLAILTRGPGDRLPAEFGVFGNTVVLYFLGLAFGTAFVLFIGPTTQAEGSR